MSELQKIPFMRMDGTEATLNDYAGKTVLVVNVASKCGLTPQYASLEAAYKQLQSRGFEIIGFPANNFAGQEPGTNDEIAEFCTVNYAVTFPVVAKISVAGADQHPLYAALIKAQPQRTTAADSGLAQKLLDKGVVPETEADVLWNFEKFLIDRQGAVVGRFAPDMTIDSPQLRSAIEDALSVA